MAIRGDEPISRRRERITGAIFVMMTLALGVLYLSQPARLESLFQLKQKGGQLWAWVTEPAETLVAPFDWSTVQLTSLARFGEEIEFLGCDIAVTREKGQVKVWQLTIWRTLTPLARDYTVYVHFVQPDDGQPFFAQGDHQLGQQFRADVRPTSRWQPGEIVVDAVLLPEAVRRDPDTQIRIGVWLPAEDVRLQPSTRLLQIDEYGRLIICQ